MTAKKIAILVVILAALAGVFSFVIWFRNHGFSAREKLSWIETVLARRAQDRYASRRKRTEESEPGNGSEYG